MKKLITISVFVSLVLAHFIIAKYDFPHSRDRQPVNSPETYMFAQRAFPSGDIPLGKRAAALREARANSSRQKSLVMTSVGPENIGGRITDIEKSNDRLIIGTASGGIFVSDDEGLTWVPTFDDQSTPAIGDLAVAPSNPDVVYAGTGEANPGGGSETYFGTGIYRSDDGGSSWTHIGLENSYFTGKIVVSPYDENTLYVAAMGKLYGHSNERGVYKTTDGGQNWQQILFISDSTGAIDLAINPNNPDEVYAAMWERTRYPNMRNYGGPTSGIYKTTDGGQNWTELQNGLPANGDDKGRIGIAISPQNPSTLYAIYADRIGYLQGIYKTTDSGNSWTSLNTSPLENMYSTYGWWFGHIWVSPENENTLFTGGLGLYKSTNGGNFWEFSTGWDTHLDQHAIFFDSGNGKIYLGNDGGLFVSSNAGSSWTKYNNLPITQFYTATLDYSPLTYYGGAQDNGTLRGNGENWENILGGDGFDVLINGDKIYAEYQYGSLFVSNDGGITFEDATAGISSSDRINWHMPVVFEDGFPSTMYCGTQRVYRSTNGGVSWTPISGDLTDGPNGGNIVFHSITTILSDPMNSAVIYVGTDDGNVQYTDDHGTNWHNITGTLPKRWVTSLSKSLYGDIYVTLSGYRYDDQCAHIFRTADNGETWEDFSQGMPDIPVNDFIIVPFVYKGDYIEEDYFAATDIGIFHRNNTLDTVWEYISGELPFVFTDIQRGSKKIAFASYGRSMYSMDFGTGTQNLAMPEPDIRFFPNPFVQNIHIDLHNIPHQKISITLISSGGNELAKLFSGDSKDISLLQMPSLPAGIYYLKVTLQDSGRYWIKKIIKI